MALPTSLKYPGAYFTLQFGVGPLSPLNAPINVALVDYGTKGPLNEAVQLTAPEVAGEIFGYGSHLYLGAVAFFNAFRFGTLYGVRVAEPTGGKAQKRGLQIAGTATAGGIVRVFINELPPIEVTITAGMKPTDQATAIGTEVGRRREYPVTAVGVADTSEMTWKHVGRRGAQFKLRFEVDSVEGSSYKVVDLVAGISDGSPVAALDSIDARPFGLVATGIDFADANFGLNPFVQWANEREGPTVGLRTQIVAATVDSFGIGTALSLSQNAHLLQITWLRNSNSLTVELAAAMAGLRALEEGSDPAHNFDMQPLPGVRGPTLASDRIKIVEANAALNAGLTPIQIDEQGNAFIGRSITSYYQDTGGGPDYRVLDTSKVSVMHFLANFMASDYLRMGFQRKKLRKDSRDQRPQEEVVEPQQIHDWIAGILYQSQDNSPVLLENVDENMPNLIAGLDPNVPGRAVARVPVDVIEGFHQLDATLRQIG